MGTLLSNHDDPLFACVSLILDAEALALDRHEEVLQTIAVVLRVTQRAISAFAERWNAARPAILPPELLVDCFQYLPFNDRLLASRVSRYWRHVALGAPVLWTRLSIAKQDGKLEEMLRRTQSAPLSLRLLLTDAEETALRPHFGRIRELWCRNAPARLDAPLLETLVVEGTYSDDVVFSRDYVGSSAESLRTLDLRGAFTVAPTFPIFSNLRELKARFTIKTPLFVVLAHCPRLESLTVWCDIKLGMEFHALFVRPLPTTLVEVSILGILRLAGPTSTTLQPWRDHRFRRLELGRLMDISAALHLFVPSITPPGSPWALEVRMDEKTSYILRTPTDQTRLIGPAFARETAAAAIASLQHFEPHIQHLTALRLAAGFFPLCVDMGLELPAVTAFTLVATPGHDIYTIPQSPNRMIVTRLRSFAFACSSGFAHNRVTLQWFFVTLPSQLRSWIAYEGEKLDTLALEGPVAKTALRKVSQRQSGLYSLAKETCIDPSAG